MTQLTNSRFVEPILTNIEANRLRRSALDHAGKAHHAAIWAECMLATASRALAENKQRATKL